MNEQPLVSIIVPCYNHESFVEDCIKGILEQDYNNIELLICDDCSSDNSYNILLEYENKLRKRFSRVKLFRNETNLGVTKNLNRMIKMSKGALIKIIASDDVMVSNAISCMVEFFAKNAETDVLISNGNKISEEQHYPEYILGEKIYLTKPNFSCKDMFGNVFRHNNIFAPGAMVRKGIFDEYGCYDENLYIEDLEFWLRILKDGKTVISFLDKNLIYYRINANSITSLYNNSQFEHRRRKFHEAEIKIFEKYRSYVGETIYAETVLFRILEEKTIAVTNGLRNYEKRILNEQKNFNLWKYISFKRKFYFFAMSFKLIGKKFLQYFELTRNDNE